MTTELDSHYIIFRISDHLYALPLKKVEQILPMVALEPVADGKPWVIGLLNLHGRILPVVDLRQLLKFPKKNIHKDDHLILMRGRDAILWTDRVEGVTEVMVEDIEVVPSLAAESRSLGGVIRTKEGMIPILDVEGLLGSSLAP